MWNAALTFFILALLASLFGVGPQIRWPWLAEAVPEPVVGEFVADDFSIGQRIRLDMDSDGVDEVAFVARKLEKGDLDFPPATVIVLSWDREADRWIQIFDGLSYATWPQEQTALGGSSDDLRLLSVRRPLGKGHDLLYGGNFGGGSRRPFQAGIVRFDGLNVRLAYEFRGTGSGEMRLVTSPTGARHVAITSQWHTQVDPGCCPARRYTLTLGEDVTEYGNYEVVADDRSSLGVVVAYDDTPSVVVVEVMPDSPAREALEVNDVLRLPEGIAEERAYNTGSPLIHHLASLQPGDEATLELERGSELFSARLTLTARGSLDDSYGRHTLDFGWSLSSKDDGVVVEYLDRTGPAGTAGVREGDRVTSINGLAVKYASDVAIILYGDSAFDPTKVGIQRSGRKTVMTMEAEQDSSRYQTYGIALI